MFRKLPTMRAMPRELLAGLFAALPCLSSPLAACEVGLEEALQPVVVTYEPFGFVPEAGITEITLRNEGEESDLDLFFRPGAFGAPEPFTVTGELVGTARPLSRVDEDRYRLTLPQGEAARIVFTARVSALGVPEPGTRDLTYQLDVLDTGTGLPCLEDAVLPVRITVPSRAQVNIAGAAGRFVDGPDLYTLDLGTLTTGLTARVAVQLRANGDAALSVVSENAGRLVHETVPDASVPYALVLDGRALDLSAESVVPAPPARSEAGVSLPLDVVVGEVPALPSGRFRDLVTITITAL